MIDRNDRAEPQFGYNEQRQQQARGDAYLPPNGSARRRRRSLVPVTLTGIAIILFGATLWMTYTKNRAPTNGVPPLIAAETTPVKIKPEQPGGMTIPYQDTTVYDQLMAGKQKPESGVEHLLQPPEQPLPKPMPAAEPSPALLPPADIPVEPIAATPAVNPDPAALAPPLPAVVAQPTPTTAPVHGAPAAPPATVLPLPAPPPAKPTQAALSQPTLQKPATTPPLPTATQMGTGFMLQLGAFHDEATANSDWQSAKTAHPGELSALHQVVEKTTVGDKTLYRLKAGPIGEAQARQDCAALKAASVVCIVVPQ